MRCLLRQSNGAVRKDLPGLAWSEGRVCLNKKYFSCCAGTGWYFLEEEDNTVQTCCLQRRFRRVEKLWAAYQGAWGEEHAMCDALQPSTSTLSLLWRWCRAMQERKIRGFARRKEKCQQPGETFALALRAVWLFDLDVQYVVLGRHDLSKLYGDFKQKSVFFVEQGETLRSTQTRQDIALLASWCENTLVPIWLELANVNKKNADLSETESLTPTLRKLQKQLGKSDQDPLRWIYPDCYSRLQNICQGLDSSDTFGSKGTDSQ